MNFQETCQYLFTRLANYQRQGAGAFTKTLDNTIRLAEFLNNPHEKFKSIHIAGTNGKGSSASMLTSILMESGLKVGVFTSPHIKSFTERIKVDGQEVSEEFVVDFVERIQPVIEELKPSFFEITTLMAFAYFERSNVDIAVIETGLGGRLDSTNILSPLVSLITNISMDHSALLGDTLELIAGEKAGIIKDETPVVISQTQEELKHVFDQKAKSLAAPISYADQNYNIIDLGIENGLRQIEIPELNEKYTLDLIASYQTRNVLGVITTLDVLKDRYGIEVSSNAVKQGLAKVVKNAGLKGRYQILQEAPKVICDCGHNEDGIIAVVEQLMSESFEKLYVVWGMSNDKEMNKIMRLLPKNAEYILCQPKIERAAKAHELQQVAIEIGLKADIIEDVNEAVKVTVENAGASDVVFIGGSTFVLSELSEL